MAQKTIVELTGETRNEHGLGIHTRLIFTRFVELGKGKKCSDLEIDTCIVLGNEKFPYETHISGNIPEGVFHFSNKRCSAEDYIDEHFKSVDMLKYKYLKMNKG